LERIKGTGDIFFARSDEPWVLSGANVHISFVGQDDGTETERLLDGQPAADINANLTVGVDLTKARRLPENAAMAYIADVKGGPFDIDPATASRLLVQPNPDGRSNADVVRPWVNGQDITRRSRGMWIVDFGLDTPAQEAALYEAPFEYVLEHVKPFRDTVARRRYRERWWLHAEAIPGMRHGLAGLRRYIVTPEVAKHHLFAWLPVDVLADHQLIAVCRDDDFVFGVLQSRAHELWALAMGTRLETRPRYTPTTCFETFPFPDPTPELRERVGEAARRLVELRDGWLNPPGLDPADLAKRTLTNLYNQRPTWLANAHADLDAAVFAAYNWPAGLSDTAILERLLALNLERAPRRSSRPQVANGRQDMSISRTPRPNARITK
jgi:hypothetical protein